MFKKIQKGNYGYLKAKRNQVLLITIVSFAISLSLLFAGIIATGNRKNLLTIVAVLGMLPASRSLVSAIMYIKAKGCSNSLHTELENVPKLPVWMYDLYFTSYQKNFALSHVVVFEKTILGLTEDEKCDASLCEKHLENQLKEGGIRDITIKIYTDQKKYLERIDQLNHLEHSGMPKLEKEVQTLLYQISL